MTAPAQHLLGGTDKAAIMVMLLAEEDASRILSQLTPDELRSRRPQHRSALVEKCLDDYLSGRRLPLDTIYQHPWPLQRG